MAERTGRQRIAALLLSSSVVLGAAACAAPHQAGELVVLPGAAERLMLAMSLGYGGAGDAKRPARVWRIAFAEDQLHGPSASGRIGDYLLENKRVSVVIANVDGGDRGGQIVDMARASGRVDDLGKLETIVSGMRVRYRTITTGNDPQLGTAYVNVVGYAERDPSMEVATRYDIGPELDTVLVHTTIRPAGRSFVGPIAVGDALVLQGGTFARGAASADPGARNENAPELRFGAAHAAAFGPTSGYVLKPLVEDAPLVMLPAASRAAIGQAPEAFASEELVLYSRALIALDRPDTLAMATALAEVDGIPTGEVELEIIPHARNTRTSFVGGRFFLDPSGSRAEGLALEVEPPIHPGDRVLARAPAGRYGPGPARAGPRTTRPARGAVQRKGRTPGRGAAPVSPGAVAVPETLAPAAAASAPTPDASAPALAASATGLPEAAAGGAPPPN